MANKKNKINELVSDDDPTDEFKVIAADQMASYLDGPLESDANTFNFHETDDAEGDPEAAISELKSDLKSRSETINRLQFDIEKLRSKWLGLETEIKAREDITKRLNQDLDSAKISISRKDKLLKKRDKLNKSLSADVRQREDDYRLLEVSNTELQEETSQALAAREESRILLERAEKRSAKLEFELKQLHIAQQQALEATKQSSIEFEKLQQKLNDSQQTIAELRQYIDGRRSSWDTLLAEVAKLEFAVNHLTIEQKTLRAELAQRNANIEQLNADLTSQDQIILELRRDNEAERRELDEIETTRRILAEQTGQLASRDAIIKELRGQFARTEVYADSLRRQLHDHLAQTNESAATREFLQQSLDGAGEKLSALSESLEDQQRISDELRQELDKMREAHAQEIRTIRFELGEAEETLAQKNLISEQLASDLIDTRGFRDELEVMLAETAEQSSIRIDKMTKQNQKLQRQIEDYERKLETKSDAINSLLGEVAKKNQQIGSIGEIEDVIHEIDGLMSERIGENVAGQRDRVTRLLIGTVGDQELRFPLFKDRLTIGRTKQNDIQLDVPYISRRHAVIVSNGETTRIIDWGSKNGVYVNTTRITEHFLKNGDVVSIGTADFRYEERPKREA